MWPETITKGRDPHEEDRISVYRPPACTERGSVCRHGGREASRHRRDQRRPGKPVSAGALRLAGQDCQGELKKLWGDFFHCFI